MSGESSYLFAQPSFIGGFASALDLGDTLMEYNYALTSEVADALAIRSDWQAVGDVLCESMASVDRENKLPRKR